ncbi:MAG: ArnT family glycosyltransferase [Planctomycetota bacterium]|jgi:hypothetical protein
MDGSRVRCCIYLLILLAVSSAVNFHRLDEKAFDGDEAIYAYVVANIERNNDPFHLQFRSPYQAVPCPYGSKPPLYFWLAQFAKQLFSNEQFALRFFSALFGVGCVLLTCLLGALLFSPEIGFIAGLFLALNHYFVFIHGARSATMDTGVTLFSLVAILLVWLAPRLKRPWMGWLGTGAAAGIVCMFKGVPPGLFMLILILLHAFLYQRGESWRTQLRMSALALAGAFFVFLPWFIFHWSLFGSYIETRHVQRFFGTLHASHLEGPLFYLGQIAASSKPFLLFLPALAVAALLSFRGAKRREFGLLALVATGWIAALTAMASKLPWYPYPVYPLIALAIAASILYPLGIVVQRQASKKAWTYAAIIVASASLLAARQDLVQFIDRKIPRHAEHFRDLRWDIYQDLGDTQRSGMRLVHLVDPERKLDRFRDYYLDLKMDGYTRVENIDQVAALLEERDPILVSINKEVPPGLIQDLEALFRRFAFCEGGRYESPFHVLFTRGLAPRLPEGLNARMHPLSGYILPLNENLCFDKHEVEPFLTASWHGAEQEGRWTEGPLAGFLFMVTRRRTLILEIDLHTYQPQHVIVLLNGTVLDWYESDGERSRHWIKLPGPLMDYENELYFYLPEARSPKSLGISNDDRVLGMKVFSMRFDELDDAPRMPGPGDTLEFLEVCKKDGDL